MVEYTFYALRLRGQIIRREAAEAATDEDARLQADRLFPDHPLIEIWCGARLVMRLDRSGGG